MSDISKKTILLVEDDSNTAEIISALLRKNRFDVLTAASGEEAIRIVSRGQMIHLILMDIILESDMDGIEAAKSILQDHDIPLIFLSGHSDTEILQRTEEIASYGYVLKHSGHSILIASIKMALNLYEARQKVRKQEHELKEIAWFKNLVFEAISDGVIMIDENGIILFVNKMIETIFGYNSSELIGRNLIMLMPEYLRATHSDSLAEYIRSGQRHLPSWSAVHIPGMHKEGFEISLEISLGENTFQGRRVFCGIIKDITERRQAEEYLNDQYSILRSIMESVDAAIFSLDRGFHYTSFNMNHACMMKAIYGADIGFGRNILEYMTNEEDRNKAKKNIERALCGERFTLEEYSGDELYSRQYFEISYNPIKTQLGKLLGVVVFAKDITERKNKDDELQSLAMELDRRVTERTAEVHDLYNNAPCGYHSLDADGLIVRMNDTALNWLGYTREEIVGKKTFDQIICNPKVFIDNFSDFKQRGWVKDLEFKMVRKDGSVFPALLNATAITDSEGRYLMSRSILFDITEFKKIEQKLRESEERFRVAIKNSPLMVFMQDKNLRYTWAYNQHPAFSSEDIIGKTDDELMPESAANINRIKRMVLKTGQGIRQEVLVSIKGKQFFHDLTVEPLIDANEQIVGVVSASMNITTHKMLEEKLRQRSEELGIANVALEKAARLKDEFLASMSHELRTPLTGVISLSEALLEEVYGELNEKQRKTIRTIESSGQHLLDLITDILDLSKIEAGQMALQIEKTSVSDICQSALQLIKGIANKKHHHVSFSMNPVSASIDADPRRLKQMLVNLLSNSVKFTPEGGQIGLEVIGDEAAEVMRFAVSDTGIGIAPEMFPMLFKPFVQLDSRLSRQYSGTGLGLSLVQRMAELHGGSVDLESKVGRGTCFTIRLPWKTSAQPEDSDDSDSDGIVSGQAISEEN